MNSLKINTFKGSHDSFIELLQESQIPYEIKMPKTNQIMACGNFIEILNITPEQIQSIVDLLIHWLAYKTAKLEYETAKLENETSKINANKYRKIFIQKQDTTIIVEGCSIEEAERLISSEIYKAKEITLIEISEPKY
ncbi:MAG: hypothetical protein AB7D29_07260 [Campylobacterales bacterium]